MEPMTFQGEEGKLVTVKIVTPSEEGQTEYKPTEYWFSDNIDYSYRLDQNNVDVDTEQVQLAENQIRYQALMDSINSEFSNLKSAMK